MKNLRIWSLLCLIWMGVLAASAQDTGKEKISLGDAMPAITLSSEIYGKVTPADLKGKVVLVSLFATWCGPCQIELAEVQKDYQKLSGEKEILQGIADRYNRLLRMLGKDMVERLVQDDIRMQAELEAKKQKEQMPKK